MREYLQDSKYIDFRTPAVMQKAQELAVGRKNSEEIAKACFLFVRDEIKHSNDFQMNPVTCKASDVLKYTTGFCYAKSHLLAALLRVNGIPAGLCYQRLTIENDSPPYCLHGLNGLYLEEYGWYRVDPRGNKPGVDARFCPPEERLAFFVHQPGEADIQGVWAEPLPQVVHILESCSGFEQVAMQLPDIEIY